MKTVYQTRDGEIFEDQSRAIAHEERLFDDWLEALKSGHPTPSLCLVVRHFTNSDELTCEAAEHYGTPWDRLRDSLRTYWDNAPTT